jgi:RNA polymerase sigma factor (sigma-70 family)
VTDEQVRLWAAEDARSGCIVRAVRNYLLRCRTHPHTAQQRAETAAQEGLIRVLEHYPASTFQTAGHFRNTVTRAAINWAITEYGRKADGAPVPLGEYDLADPSTEPEENWTDECLKQFRAAFEKLGAEDRELLRLKFVEGWTLERIAGHLNTTLHRVWYRLNSLRQQLRQELERENDSTDTQPRARP